jgi:hypothetical protein
MVVDQGRRGWDCKRQQCVQHSDMRISDAYEIV